jgi:hypothetical protein
MAAWLFVCPPLQGQGNAVEDEIKAAYIFNFTKFIGWPASAFTGTSDPLNVCVTAEAAVLRSVERVLAGERVEGRPLRVVSPLPEDAASCHVLFVGRGGSERGLRFMAQAGTAPMLTVGDSPRFLQQGGMIAFVVENRRVRFDINVPVAERAGLKLSSKLLRVARNVTAMISRQ